MTTNPTLELTTCVDCSHHQIQADPDPHDWFCRDDVKVYCTLGKFNCAVACRPYHTQAETSPPPQRCPLREVSV